MNKQIEALKMAIEAVEGQAFGKYRQEVVAKLKEALAEAEQKQKKEDALTRLIQNSEELGGYDMQPIKPLVTAPSITISNNTANPATWQGLSDDEIKSTYKELFPTTTMKLNSALIKYVQTLELILRDKNERK